MKKKQIFWLVVVAIITIALVFVKCAPFWVSINALVSFAAGVVIGWWAKMFYDKYIKPVKQ
jgi:hypothetical protein